MTGCGSGFLLSYTKVMHLFIPTSPLTGQLQVQGDLQVVSLRVGGVTGLVAVTDGWAVTCSTAVWEGRLQTLEKQREREHSCSHLGSEARNVCNS